MGILAAEAFVVQSIYHKKKDKSTGQIVFGRDMILPINHVAYWRYICERKQTQINKDINHENTTRIDHDYRVGDKFTNKNRSAYKYKTLFRGLYEIFQTWTNGTIALQMVAVTNRINISNIKPYNDAEV